MDYKKASKILLIAYSCYYVIIFDNYLLGFVNRIFGVSDSLLNVNFMFLYKIYHTIPFIFIILYLLFRKRIVTNKLVLIFRKFLWVISIIFLIFGVTEQIIGVKLFMGLFGSWETMTLLFIFLLNLSYILESSSLPYAEQLIVLCLMWFTIQGSYEIVYQFFLNHYSNIFDKQIRVIVVLYAYYVFSKKYKHKIPKRIWIPIAGILLCWTFWLVNGFKHHGFEPEATTMLEEISVIFGWRMNKVMYGLTHLMFLGGFKE